MSDWLRVTTRA
jgi:hypothetical protein